MISSKLKPFLAFVLLFCASLYYAQNSLKVSDISAAIGEKTKILVELNNSEPIIGTEFTLIVPKGLIVKENESVLTEQRKGEDHALFSNIDKNGNYHFMVFSYTNTPFKGNSGVLIEIPIEIPANYTEGKIYDINLSGVVVSSTKMQDVGSDHKGGKLMIKEGFAPDLKISGVSITQPQITPETTITVSWGVENIGKTTASGGWIEQINLISEKNNQRYLLGNVAYDEDLPNGETISRQGEFKIPRIIGIDGNCKIEVNLVPNPSVKEPESNKENNKAITNGSVLLQKLLFLEIDKKQIQENSTEKIRILITRSGDRNSAQTFTIKSSVNKQLKLPATISIQEGESSAIFYTEPIDNQEADGNRIVKVSVSGNEYPETASEITLIDDEIPSFTLLPSKNNLDPGDAFSLSLQFDKAPAKDIKIALETDLSKRLKFPEEIIVKAGNTHISLDVETIDTKIPEVEITGKITARAVGYKQASTDITLNNANIPNFEFTISPSTISEADGIHATYAIIKRLTQTDVTVSLTIQANVADALILPAKITFSPGQTQQKFTIGAVDNSIVEGTREINVAASVIIPSCGCSGESQGITGTVFTQKIILLDDDGLALKVTANPSTIKAGQQKAAKIIIARNTTKEEELAKPVIVNLSSDAPTIVKIPSTVEIPSGKSSIEVEMDTQIDPNKKGDQTIRIQAEAKDYSTGFNWVLVTDQNKPDAIITEISALAKTEGGELLQVSTQIKNQGFAALPKGMKVEYYLSANSSIKDLKPLGETITKEDITAGKSINLTQNIQLPEQAGKYNLIVVLNSNRKIEELTYINNQLLNKLELLPNYIADIKVDNKVYKPGEIISISGSAKKIKGGIAANKPVEIKITNDGFIRSFTVQTNATGNFAYDFIPLGGENGHYKVSAGYPGTEVKTQDEFDLLGVVWVNKPSDYLKWEATEGGKIEGEFKLKNNTQTNLTNIQVKLPANVDFTIQSEPLNLTAGQEGTLTYSIIPNQASPERKYYEINANFISTEGANTPFTSWYYCHTEKARLIVDPVSINTTMIKGKSRLYELTVINTGATEAKKIKIDLPKLEWMKLKSPSEIEKLGSFDTLKIALELKPTDKQQLHVPLSGNIALTISNGQGVNIPFKVETVSEDKGSLQIDVVDEYTYNTQSAPHVEGAKVVVRHPYTGVIVAEGTTDNKGLFSTKTIPEGWYSVTVTANKHDSYQNNFQIEPGRTNKQNVFISYQAVSYEWKVKPTEVEDEYQTDLEVKFETNVPKPVVTIEADETLLNLEPGQSKIINLTITNHGLIAANKVRISINDFGNYTLTLLTNYIEVLNAKSSIVVPVLAQRSLISLFGSKPCAGSPKAEFTYPCGKDEKSGSSQGNPIHDNSPCDSSNNDYPRNDNGPGYLGGAGFGGMVGWSELANIINSIPRICDHYPLCIINILSAAVTCFPPIGIPTSAITCIASIGTSGDLVDLGLALGGCFGKKQIVNCIISVISVLKSCLSSNESSKSITFNNIDDEKRWKLLYENFTAFDNVDKVQDSRIKAIFNDENWRENEDFSALLLEVSEYLDNDKQFSSKDIEKIKLNLEKTSFTKNYIDTLCKRWNVSIDAWNNGILSPNKEYPNIISKDSLVLYSKKIQDFHKYLNNRGYDSTEQMLLDDLDFLKESKKELDKTQSSVCASVSVRFSQKMTMTREAFEGTLEINNSSLKEIKDINLDLVITDEEGNDMTHLFQINKEAFLSGSGFVGANSNGVGTVIFIPTKEAAPTVAKSYSFGGTLSYLDPETGEKVTAKLYPVTLEVNPSPDLVLHYFMQRDIIGDDPLTEKVEPMVPAEMSLLIKNEGYGTARNIKIQSMQPEIIENKKGLLIDFNMIGSNLNNEPKQMGLLEVDFGNIESQKTKVGQWWFTSTLLGHFIEYDIKIKHLSSYGNKNLSLIKDYQVHELIKSVKAYGLGQDDIPDFLVNDIPDMNDTPDMLYYSNGDSEKVSKVATANISNEISPSKLTAQLTITPSINGWNYGNINDPGKDLYKLVKVIRNEDKLEIPIENFWQTFVTLRDGKEPKYENKLHFIDKVSARATYTLYYTSIDTDIPKIVSLENLPENGTTTQPVEYIQVNFNKPINKETFTYKNLRLTHQGSSITLDGSKVNIGMVNDSVFVINIKSLTTASGHYELNVQCAGIKDTKGNEGIEGKSASWTQIIENLGIMQFTSDQNKSQSLNSIEVIFNKKVSPSEFTKSKITINGKTLDTVEITNIAGEIKYLISGLEVYNIADGTYELSVNLPEMKAKDGSAGVISQTFNWKVDNTPPKIENFTLQYQGAAHTQNVTGIQLTLNKPLAVNFKPSWIKLYQNNEIINIAVTVTKLDDLNYLISELGDFTQLKGEYKLVVKQEEFIDESGNYGAGETNKNWIVNFDKPSSVAYIKVTPDRGISDIDNITSGKDTKIIVKTTEDNLKVALYVITPGGEYLIKEIYKETAGTLEIPIGNYTGKNIFKAITYNSYGNASEPVTLEVYIDTVELDASLLPVKSEDSCAELENIKIIFTDTIIASELTLDALIVKAGGIRISSDGLTISPVSEKEYVINNLQQLKNNGDISIGIDLKLIHKKLSGLQGTKIQTIQIGEIKENIQASISGPLTSYINQTVTYRATSGMTNYKWKVTGGTITRNEGNEISVIWTKEGKQTITLEYQNPELCNKTTSIQVKIDNSLPMESKVLQLTPIPNRGQFILLMKDIEGKFTLNIYDMVGRNIYTENNIEVTQNFAKKIDIRPIQSGVYHLVLHNSQHTYKIKFITY